MNKTLRKLMCSVYDVANEINKILYQEFSIPVDTFVPLQSILDAVKKFSHFDQIAIFRKSFASLAENDKKLLNTNFPGAMLATYEKDGKQTAEIILNEDLDSNMQRFSVVHELGHLVTKLPNFTYEKPNDGLSTLSAHINPDITLLDENEYENEDYLIAEQMANIFALLVLIHRDLKIKDLTTEGVDVLSAKYGVTEDAIFSRIILSSMRPSMN